MLPTVFPKLFSIYSSLQVEGTASVWEFITFVAERAAE